MSWSWSLGLEFLGLGLVLATLGLGHDQKGLEHIHWWLGQYQGLAVCEQTGNNIFIHL